MIDDNASLNGLTNISIHQCALGQSSGSGMLHQISVGNPGQAKLIVHAPEDAIASEAVEVRMLPALLQQDGHGRADVIKIDVEGGELDVLLGAAQLFDTNPPRYVLFECIDENLRTFGHSGVELLTWLADRGYTLDAYHHGRWQRVRASDRVDGDIVAEYRG